MKPFWCFFFRLPQATLVGCIKAYRLLLSPSLGSGCRFEPTCSAYALQALEQHGAVAGSYLTLRRLSRCHPWCDGGLDPVPPQRSQQHCAQENNCFTRLVTPVATPSSEKNSS